MTTDVLKVSGNYIVDARNGNITLNAGTGTVTVTGNLTVAAPLGITTGDVLISSCVPMVFTTDQSQILDTFSADDYTSAKYVLQITDGVKVHMCEITVFHDAVQTYKTEYGIHYNDSELGTFDTQLVDSTVQLSFTPNYIPTSLSIKGTKTLIAA